MLIIILFKTKHIYYTNLKLEERKKMKCKKGNKTVDVTWKLFAPRCPKVGNQNACGRKSAAYVAAITVCKQRL